MSLKGAFFLMILFGAAGAGGFTAITDPEGTKKALSSIDFIGITEAGKIERQRQYDIMNLPIEYEKKLVMIDRKVFIGITPEYTRLALGQPIQIYRKSGDLYWIYQLDGDKRPTALVFKGGRLEKAFKTSFLEVQGETN
jgi:hypothetical protein